MFTLKRKIRIGLALLTGLILTSCGENRSGEARELQEIQNWIYDTLDKWYFWNEGLISKDKVNFFEEPQKLFYSLLSPLDGKKDQPYSYIEKKLEIPTRSISQTEYSYGFDFLLANITDGKTKYLGVLITYTVPNSPATEAKLLRGDIINTIDGAAVSTSNALSMVGGPAKKITVIRGDQLLTIELGSAREVEDNPVYLVKKFNNDKIGYLAYNHFTPGNKDEYDNSLRQAAVELDGVEKLILDFRYNNGGSISSAEVLLSLFGPSQSLNETVGYLEYNKTINRKEDITTSSKKVGNGKNINIQEIYVLTSQSTASASELVINSLRTYIPVHVIGTTTVGKNMGSVGFDKNEWHIQPIVCQIFNNDKQSDYSDGFKPGIYSGTTDLIKENYKVEETLPFYPIGSPSDPLIRRALQIINQGGGVNTRANTEQRITPVINSVDLRRSNNLIVNP